VLTRSAAAYRGVAALSRLVPIAVVGFLVGCGGGARPSPPTSTPSGPTPSSSPTAASSFGMQCGIDDPADCQGSGATLILWPTAQAKPGMLRLHDAGTHWAALNTNGPGQYNWTPLNNWLDLIAQHEPIDVNQVFSWAPCWAATICSAPTVEPNGTNVPPSDLTASGSPSFNNFVTAFVQHCSPAGNCVSSIIKYYEMWNEWDTSERWAGTPLQLYQMVAPATAIIRQNVPNAVILTTSVTPASPTFDVDLATWLAIENLTGKISDWVDWHLYLSGTTTTTPPEQQWTNFAEKFLSQQLLSVWGNAPWANTETNFSGATNYTCLPSQYTADDCTGQIVRWQLLHASNGASSLDWYKWYQTIGNNPTNPQYETAYYYMMQYMLGGKFPSGPCTSTTDASGNHVWTCDFTESTGTTAMFIWTPNENGTSFTVPSGYIDYRDLSGNTTTVTAGAQITIGVEPFLLEQ
jgi:hypothetical protein